MPIDQRECLQSILCQAYAPNPSDQSDRSNSEDEIDGKPDARVLEGFAERNVQHCSMNDINWVKLGVSAFHIRYVLFYFASTPQEILSRSLQIIAKW